jgi:hypothetical protein
MTTTRPAWAAEPVTLHTLVSLSETASIEVLRSLVGPPAPRAAVGARSARRRAIELACAVLGVVALIVLYALAMRSMSGLVDLAPSDG